MDKKWISTAVVSCTVAMFVSGFAGASEKETPPQKRKNIIVMISDGASDGTWDIASFWQHGKLSNETFPYSVLETRYAMATHALNGNKTPDLSSQCDPDTYADGFSYDADKASDSNKSKQQPFAGYEYIGINYTDSAASGTAIATGQSTYNSAISVNNCGKELPLITEYAKANNLATGVVSSVPFSHATPAVFGAKNISRHNGAKIGSDMLTNGHLDLIMGTGHPIYDQNGQQQQAMYNYISEAGWKALQDGKLYPIGSGRAWQLVESKADFEKLAANNANQEWMNSPLIGLVQNNATLQQSRSNCGSTDVKTSYACPYLPSSPTLKTMSLGALNYLNQNENGFFVMIEGGAVDWAAHANDTARIIEEQIDFNQAAGAVYNWVEKNSNWDETLLIVTTDHGNAYVLGPDSDKTIYNPVSATPKNAMPEVKYYSVDHTNELVRLYAKGSGAEKFANYVVGKDKNYPTRYRHSGTTGDYIQNKHIFNVVKDAIEN